MTSAPKVVMSYYWLDLKAAALEASQTESFGSPFNQAHSVLTGWE